MSTGVNTSHERKADRTQDHAISGRTLRVRPEQPVCRSERVPGVGNASGTERLGRVPADVHDGRRVRWLGWQHALTWLRPWADDAGRRSLALSVRERHHHAVRAESRRVAGSKPSSESSADADKIVLVHRVLCIIRIVQDTDIYGVFPEMCIYTTETKWTQGELEISSQHTRLLPVT